MYDMGAPHEFTNPAAIDPETPMKVCMLEHTYQIRSPENEKP